MFLNCHQHKERQIFLQKVLMPILIRYQLMETTMSQLWDLSQKKVKVRMVNRRTTLKETQRKTYLLLVIMTRKKSFTQLINKESE